MNTHKLSEPLITASVFIFMLSCGVSPSLSHGEEVYRAQGEMTDFFVGTGDNVYYDTHPREAFAKTPTQLVGPDDAYKIDNHTNNQGFRHEGREFFKWIVEQQLHEQGFYTACGDRHWQYHSRGPLGVEEFSCGALVDENSRLGRKPGDPKSTDPKAEIKQFYTQSKKSGGFLRITVGPGKEPGTGSARFTFLDALRKGFIRDGEGATGGGVAGSMV